MFGYGVIARTEILERRRRGREHNGSPSDGTLLCQSRHVGRRKSNRIDWTQKIDIHSSKIRRFQLAAFIQRDVQKVGCGSDARVGEDVVDAPEPFIRLNEHVT